MPENSKPGNAEPQKAFEVVVTQEGQEISRVPINKPKMFIGRMAQNEIVLSSPQVSRSHAMLTFTMGRVFVVDQGSQNGTFLNGKSVLQDEVKVGDILSIGPFHLKILEGSKKDAPSPRYVSKSPEQGETTLDPDDLDATLEGKKPRRK